MNVQQITHLTTEVISQDVKKRGSHIESANNRNVSERNTTDTNSNSARRTIGTERQADVCNSRWFSFQSFPRLPTGNNRFNYSCFTIICCHF